MKLRTGRKVGRTLYRQLGDTPADDDPIIGLVDTPELAARIVAAEAAEAEAYEHKQARAELNERCTQYRMRAEAAEARLVEVEALCAANEGELAGGDGGAFLGEVRAAARWDAETCPPHRYPEEMPDEVIAWRCTRCGEAVRD